MFCDFSSFCFTHLFGLVAGYGCVTSLFTFMPGNLGYLVLSKILSDQTVFIPKVASADGMTDSRCMGVLMMMVLTCIECVEILFIDINGSKCLTLQIMICFLLFNL